MSNETMNGAEPVPPVHMANPVIQAIEQLLAAAKAGAVNSLAAIVVDANGAIQTLAIGARKGDMHLGMEMLQTQLIHGFLNPQAQGRILRPRG